MTKTRPRQKTKTILRTWSSRRSPGSAGFFVLILIKVRNFAIIHRLAPTAVSRVLLGNGRVNNDKRRRGGAEISRHSQPMDVSQSQGSNHIHTHTTHTSCATNNTQCRHRDGRVQCLSAEIDSKVVCNLTCSSEREMSICSCTAKNSRSGEIGHACRMKESAWKS